jgi:hypothetical protein
VPTPFTIVVRFNATGLVSQVWAFFHYDQAVRSVEEVPDA